MSTSIDIFKRILSVNGSFVRLFNSDRDLNVPVVDTNGDAVATTVVGGEVQVDDLPAPKDLDILIPYSSGDTSAEITIVTDSGGTITTATTTGLTSVVYKINTVVVTLPFTLAVNDVLNIGFDAAGADGTIKLEGNYV